MCVCVQVFLKSDQSNAQLMPRKHEAKAAFYSTVHWTKASRGKNIRSGGCVRFLCAARQNRCTFDLPSVDFLHFSAFKCCSILKRDAVFILMQKNAEVNPERCKSNGPEQISPNLGRVRFDVQKEPEPENPHRLLVGVMPEPIRRQDFLVLVHKSNMALDSILLRTISSR